MKKKSSINKVTLEDVLMATERSFDSLQKDINDIRNIVMVTKDDIARLEATMATKDDIARIEYNHERRIEILEDDVRVLKTTVEKR